MGQCNEIIVTQLCIYACILYMFTYTLNCFYVLTLIIVVIYNLTI